VHSKYLGKNIAPMTFVHLNQILLSWPSETGWSSQ